MKKKIITMASLLGLALMLGGCEVPQYTEKEVEEDKVLEATYNDDLEEVHEIERIKDLGDFTLVTKYDTIDYDLNKWKIIDNKTIKMSVWTEGLPSGWEAIIEHVHIDMFIDNKLNEKPTILQDSMDDKYHGFQQDGFKISDEVKYENIFGVIGASDKLHASVSIAGDYSLRLVDLRESDFTYESYNSNKMQVIYDVMIKKPDNDYFEPIAVYDEIIIPVGVK